MPQGLFANILGAVTFFCNVERIMPLNIKRKLLNLRFRLSGENDSATALEVRGNLVIAVGYAGDSIDKDLVVRAYHPKTGELIWEDIHDTGGIDWAEAIAIGKQSAYVLGAVRPGGSSDFAVRAYDLNTGVLRWEDTFDFAGGNVVAI
jgi:hypothetical protein